MVLKRFSYKNGLDIIAPCKCGTRWLERKTNPINIIGYLHTDFIQNINAQTYWVYRNGNEHLLSALKTEIRGSIDGAINDTLQDIISNFLKGGFTSTHWSADMYKQMYIHWKKVKFNLINLNNLSDLFENIDYNYSDYNLREYTKSPNTNEFIINVVGEANIKILNKMVSDDEVYLYYMLSNIKNLI